MNWIINNWFLIIGALSLLAIGCYYIRGLFKSPIKGQISKIQEWLIYACIEAEKAFGSKTGQIKLRYVYDKFITKFAGISNLISFEFFSYLVDEALETVRKMLESNKNIAEYVEGTNGNSDKTQSLR